MDMRKTLVPVQVKELGDRVLEIAGSTEDIDRQQDIIRSKGWKLASFKKNPVFLWAHDYSQPPIGRARKVWIDKETKRLMFEVEFADAETYEFADTIYKLFQGGFLHATSVGFIPLDWEGKSEEEPYPKWEGNVFTSQELLELSAVPVPANAEALVNARDSGLITVKQFEAVTKPEETDDYIRIPVKGEAGNHDGHRIRTIDIDKDKGIKALYCGECKKVITYLFDKEKDWTQDSAQAWVDEHEKRASFDLMTWGRQLNEQVLENFYSEHEKTIREANPISQEQIRDDLDYIDQCIGNAGLSAQTAFDAVDVAIRILARAWPYHQWHSIILGAFLTGEDEPIIFKRITGNDISVQIEAPEDKEPPPDPAIAARERALEVAEVAHLVLARLKGKRIY